MDNPDIMPDAIPLEPKKIEPRIYDKRTILVPNEIEVPNQKANPFQPQKHMMFKTSDQELYIRNGMTGEIRTTSKEVKGKANKKAAKRNKMKCHAAQKMLKTLP